MIKNICTSSNVLARGFKYYFDERVAIVDMDEESGIVEAVVSGGEDYSVSLEFSRDGSLAYYECSCPAYHEYPGGCKHIVATLLQLKDQRSVQQITIKRGKVIDLAGVKQAGEIISFFENRLPDLSKEPVNMEVLLELLIDRGPGGNVRPVVSLRLGSRKLYTVKSIKNLLKSMDAGESIEFGKGFTFDPYINCFREDDLPVINFFREMRDIDETVERNSSYGYSYGSSPSLFKGKYLYLPSGSVGRFLKIMEGRQLRVVVNGVEYDGVKIVDGNYPAEFSLRKSGNELLLNVDIPDGIVFLTPDGGNIFLNGTIYNVPKSQRENIAPFHKSIAATGRKEFRFSQKDGERFASLVIPNIKKAGRLNMDEDVERMFLREPLNAEVYLDKLDDKITAAFSFNYGDYKIDPFDQNQNKNGDTIVIRDYESERKILALFEKPGFKIKGSLVYLSDDERIYEFITEYVPDLQQVCDVYYSDAFKSIRLFDSSRCRSAVRLNEKSDLLEFDFSIDGIDRESLPGIFASLKKKRKFYRLPDGSFIPLNSDGLKNLSDMIDYLDLDEDDLKKDVINLPKFKAMYLDDSLNGLDSVYVERNLTFKKLIENIKEPKNTNFTVPESLKDIMRGYQVTGFKWLKTLSSYGLGGILADDMGLGKTLETIAFIESERDKDSLPSIVICPTSLVYNWESEIQKFAPDLRTLVIAGNKGEREELIGRLDGADIVITSYPLIRRDIDSYREVSFSYCILDEAQHIKNPDSVNAKSVKEIRAKGYFALTGTPIENNLTELWSIFDFIMPGFLLSHRRFVEKFERPIVGEGNQDSMTELGKHVRPFILRRLKKDVLKELPPKIESMLTAELTDEQKKVYLAYLEQISGRIKKEIDTNGFERSQIAILAGLTRLRQICCHPSLFIENYSGASGKMDMLLELFEELREGSHRTLLFSQFTGVLKLIREQLDKEKISYFYLDGSTRVEDRGEMVKAFNNGFRDVFLISLKAGGTGLNLTGADTVIHFDPWWNPAAEEQATDRAYRIGQENTVQVMKLVTKGTIEEKIYAMQQRKKELINSVLQPGETFISKMTKEDVMGLFNI
jgi:Superfamily II DNA/RNA helicases, SNF2 family